MSAILRFAGQAKRSGAADTYAIARRELDARDLGRLLAHLHRIDPDWQAPLKERRGLAAELLEAGVSDSTVIEQTGMSRTTLCGFAGKWSTSRNALVNPHCRAPRMFQTGQPAMCRPYGPILSCDASSGNGDFEAIRRLLGAQP
jgi:hypothetical protein